MINNFTISLRDFPYFYKIKRNGRWKTWCVGTIVDYVFSSSLGFRKHSVVPKLIQIDNCSCFMRGVKEGIWNFKPFFLYVNVYIKTTIWNISTLLFHRILEVFVKKIKSFTVHPKYELQRRNWCPRKMKLWPRHLNWKEKSECLIECWIIFKISTFLFQISYKFLEQVLRYRFWLFLDCVWKFSDYVIFFFFWLRCKKNGTLFTTFHHGHMSLSVSIHILYCSTSFYFYF